MAKKARVEVKVKSNVDTFKKNVVDKMPTILKEIGRAAEGYAKKDSPVDTGLLRNSLTFAISGEAPDITAYAADKEDEQGVIRTGEYKGVTDAESRQDCYSVIVGSNVVYAPKQELNDAYHHTVGKAHFIRDALQDHREEYKDIIEAAILSIPGVK